MSTESSPLPAESASASVDASICVVSYNTASLLRRCLQSVFSGQSGLRAEVIVVDNNSHDDSVAMVRNEFPSVSVIANHDNKGYAAAANQAIAMARGAFVVMVNPDAYLFPDTLSCMLQILRDNTRIGVAGCLTVNEAGEPCPTARHRPTIFRGLVHAFGVASLLPGDRFLRKYAGGLLGRRFAQFSSHTTAGEPDYLDGGVIFVRREAIQDAGLMDDNLFLNSEDFDWCARIKRFGWHIYYTPVTKVCHEMHSSKTAVKEFSFLQFFRSYLYVLYKHNGRLSYSVVRLATIVGMILRMAVALLSTPFTGASRVRTMLLTYKKVVKLCMEFRPADLLARRRDLVQSQQV